MGEAISSRLNVLDFIIAVLMRHEKNLDKSLANLEKILERLGKKYSDKNLSGKLNLHSRVPPRENYSQFGLDNSLSHYTNKDSLGRQRVSNPPQNPSPKQIESAIFRLVIEGKSIEEIAQRLDINPIGVKQIIENLVRKGYLPPDNSPTRLEDKRI